MMSSVCAEDRLGIRVVQFLEPLESAVYIYIMDEEISQAINGNPHPHEKQPELWSGGTNDVTSSARDGEYEEEQIIPFKEAGAHVWFVVVFVPIPKKAVHYVFMREPCHEFHPTKSGDDNECIKQCFHDVL
jgi:hypothetical protein